MRNKTAMPEIIAGTIAANNAMPTSAAMRRSARLMTTRMHATSSSGPPTSAIAPAASVRQSMCDMRAESYTVSMSTARLETFTDGVIAILITIMVLELKVPHGADLEALTPLLPVFLTYILSFVFLG